MKKTRRHRRMLAAVRTVSFVMTMVMLFTLFPAMNALGEDVAQESESAKSVSTAAELSEQTFELEPEDGVTVTLTGLMPTDGYAKAKTVTVEEEDVLHAYDITIYYRNGKEFEPDEGSPISVCFNSKAIADAIKDEDVSLEAEHIADDGKKESVELTSAAGGEAVFEAESFSIYLIKEHDDNSEDTATPRVFYHFLSQNYTQVEDGEDIYYTAGAYSFPNKYNEMVDTQIIKNGEKLQEVVIPENNDAGMFYGWYRVHLREENNGVYSYDWGTGTPERQEFNTA
ncbi:MAG: hypothetical protein II118_02675, partial [Ruminococcus sp.]|nr:hypothetical protein [Ruminococcus sp.]